MMAPLRVALLAGRRRSPASLLMLSALDRLRAEQIEVAAVLCVSELRWARLWDWYLRFGWQAAGKALRELGVGKSSAGTDPEQAWLRETLYRWSVSARSLPELCRARGIPFHVVPDINGDAARNLLATHRCELGVYSGAGILRQPLLDRLPRGVLNLHCGSLPAIRGMNGVEWNLFFGKRPETTLHFIDAGIDTGNILASCPLDVAPNDRLGTLRGKAIVAGIELLTECLPQLDRLVPRDNPARHGRQYYAMAEPLKALLEDRLSRPPRASSAEDAVAHTDFLSRAAL